MHYRKINFWFRLSGGPRTRNIQKKNEWVKLRRFKLIYAYAVAADDVATSFFMLYLLMLLLYIYFVVIWCLYWQPANWDLSFVNWLTGFGSFFTHSLTITTFHYTVHSTLWLYLYISTLLSHCSFLFTADACLPALLPTCRCVEQIKLLFFSLYFVSR